MHGSFCMPVEAILSVSATLAGSETKREISTIQVKLWIWFNLASRFLLSWSANLGCHGAGRCSTKLGVGSHLPFLMASPRSIIYADVHRPEHKMTATSKPRLQDNQSTSLEYRLIQIWTIWYAALTFEILLIVGELIERSITAREIQSLHIASRVVVGVI